VISFVVDRFPKKLNALFRIISEIIVIGISFILIVYSPRILQVSAIQKSPALQLPMFYIYISVPICGCLFILYSISHICDIIYNDFFNKNKEVLS
jgi:TRAP-type C4-dicarboxylate transport system permease small subunit